MDFGKVEGWVQSEPSEAPAAGEVIAGKYVVERVLGAGGMGVVLAARHQQLGHRVAVKFIRAAAAEDASAVGRFLREARAAAALSNEHVTRVLDVGTLETGVPFMVMEYLAGDDLGALLKQRGPLPVADAVGFVLQACEAIAEAHSLGIVHRDLKPSNIFVTTDPDGGPLVKLMDFGISKMMDATMAGDVNTLTANGAMMGSPSYMSPEQVRSARDVDPRTDIWALGVVLFELLAGTPPFAGETLGETFAKILGDPPRPLASVRPDVPSGLVTVIAQCLEKRIDQRFQSVSALAPRLLPFAGAQASRSIDRIRRFAKSGTAGASEASRPARSSDIPARVSETPGQSSASPARSSETPPSLETVGAPVGDTGPAWLRSAAGREPPPRSLGGFGVAALVGLLLSAAAVGIYVVRDRAPAAISPGAAASAAAPPPAVQPVDPAAPAPVQPTPTSATPLLSGVGEPVEPSVRPRVPAESPDSGQSVVPSAVRRAPAGPVPSAAGRKMVPNAPPPSSTNSPLPRETDIF